MKRWLPLLALVAAGCDDPAAADLAASVLAHGMTRAYADCSPSGPGFALASGYGSLQYRISLFQDGSCFVTTSGNTAPPFQPNIVHASGFTPRGDAKPCRNHTSGSPATTLFVGSGAIRDGQSPPNTFLYDISDNCTGFNLEAFDDL